MSTADETEFIEATIASLKLRPGYQVTTTRNSRGHVLEFAVLDTVNAYNPDGPPRTLYPETLLVRPEDLVDEEALVRRIVQGLVNGDLHEHLEFLRVRDQQPWNPHKDPAAAPVELPPYWRINETSKETP